MALSAEERAAKVEAIIFDVDGVLTAGDIVLGSDEELKVFNVQDGHGFRLAQKAGLKLAMLTGRESGVVERRARELDVDELVQGVWEKGAALPELFGKMGVTGEKACYVGDDLVDIPAMRQVGFPVAVANAVDEVKEQACWTTTRVGGAGAAREVIEFVLKAKDLWGEIMKPYIEGEK